MNPFEGLRKLFTSSVDGVAPMDDKFVKPDRDATARSLRLVERGEEQGALNLPPSDAQTLDFVEREIVNHVGEHWNSAHIDACNHVRAYEERLAELHLLHGRSAIKAETKICLGDLKVLVGTWNEALSPRKDALRASYRDLFAFRQRHGLLDVPFKEDESTWVHSATIASALAIETSGNTFFLSANDEMGFLGGAVAAVFVAAVNVAFAVATGRFALPLTNSRFVGQRLLGWALVVAWAVLFLFLWNLAAAHFRDVKSAGIAAPEEAVLSSMASGLFSLDSLYSWGLLSIGMLAAAVAARTGYLMEDPYPGYGAKGRTHNARCHAYASLVAEAKDDLQQKRNAAISEAKEAKEELALQIRTRGRVHAAYGHLNRRFAKHRSVLEDFGNYLLELYRNANRRARQTEAPTTFAKAFERPPAEIPELHEQVIGDEAIAATDRALDEAIETIAAAFDESIDSFVPLEQLRKELERATV